MQEGQDVFKRLRELWKQWPDPEFQNLQAPLLFDRFRVDDAQGHCARKVSKELNAPLRETLTG